MTTFVHTTTAKIEDDPKSKWGRRLVFTDEQEFRRMLMRYTPGVTIQIGTKEKRAKHSPEQRGYLRGVVIPAILKEMGMEDSKENNDVMYLKLKEKFGPCEIRYGKDGPEGEVMAFPKSARDYTTQDMSQLIDGCIRWAGEFLNLKVPPPDRTMTSGGGI